MHVSSIKVNGQWVQAWDSLYGAIAPPTDELLIAQEDNMNSNETEVEFDDPIPGAKPPFEDPDVLAQHFVDSGADVDYEDDEDDEDVLVLEGAVFSVHFHEDLIPFSGREQGKEFFLTQFISGIAFNAQNSIAWSKMRIEDMMANAQHRLDRESNADNQLEIETQDDSEYGKLAGLTENQREFMADLEEGIDRAESILRSCRMWFDTYNTDPSRKLLRENLVQAMGRIQRNMAKADEANARRQAAATAEERAMKLAKRKAREERALGRS